MPAPGADADRGNREPPRDRSRHRPWDALQNDCKAARRLKRDRVFVQLARLVPLATLGLVAAEDGGGLRGQADVAHHRDAGAPHGRRPAHGFAAALELDRVGPRLLDEAAGVSNSLLVRHLVAHERQVADHQRAVAAASNGTGEDQQLIHGGTDRGHRVVAKHVVRRRVADEHEVDAAPVDDPGGGMVVGRDHDDRVAADLHLGQGRQ